MGDQIVSRKHLCQNSEIKYGHHIGVLIYPRIVLGNLTPGIKERAGRTC